MKKSTCFSAFLICLAALSFGQEGNALMRNLPDHIRDRKAYKRAEWFTLQRQLPFDAFPVFHFSSVKNSEIQNIISARSVNYTGPAWEPLGPGGITTGMPNWGTVSGRVRAVAVHPTDPLTVYIGAASGGIWKTTDGGESWQDIGHSLPAQSFGAIAIDPMNADIVYAGSGECNLLSGFNALAGNGLYKSTDGGQTWSVLTNGFGPVTFFSDLVVNPENPDMIFASLGGGLIYTSHSLSNEGVWRSLDGGVTWARTLAVAEASDIAFHPENPDIVYAAAGGYMSPLSGFYISNDGGETWLQSNSGISIPPLGGRMQFDISMTEPNIIYAVIYGLTDSNDPSLGLSKAYKSEDGGSTWSQISAGTHLGGYYNGWYDQGWYDLCIAVDPTNSDHVLIGNVELHRTQDGEAFSPVRPYEPNANGSLVHVDYHKLVYAPSDPGYLYIGCDGGIYVSYNKGFSAKSINLGLETLQFYRIASRPDKQAIMIGGMQDNGFAFTANGGQNWGMIFGADGMECFFDRTNPSTHYLSIQNGDLWKLGNGYNYIHLQSMNGAWITPFFMHPVTPGVIFVATKSIWKSENYGTTFTAIADSVAPSRISTMAQSTVNPSNMIFGTGMDYPPWDNVFYVKISIDEGVTWTDVTGNIPGEARWISRVVTDPVNENTMYVLRTGFSAGNKVWKTQDLGQTWVNISGNLPDLPVSDLFIDPDNNSNLYLANDIGVYLSENGGASWEYASEGIPFVTCMDFDYLKIENRGYLRVGTYGRSIYETRLGYGFGTEENESGHQLLAVTSYPNPVNSVATIGYHLEKNSHVNMRIYNIIGQEIETLVNESQEKGKHQVLWNAGEYPTGIYFYKISTSCDTKSITGKLVIVR